MCIACISINIMVFGSCRVFWWNDFVVLFLHNTIHVRVRKIGQKTINICTKLLQMIQFNIQWYQPYCIPTGSHWKAHLVLECSFLKIQITNRQVFGISRFSNNITNKNHKHYLLWAFNAPRSKVVQHPTSSTYPPTNKFP